MMMAIACQCWARVHSSPGTHKQIGVGRIDAFVG